MAMLGCKFFRFPYSADGTGSINFDTIEQVISSNVIKDDQLNSYDEIFEFIEPIRRLDRCELRLLT